MIGVIYVLGVLLISWNLYRTNKDGPSIGDIILNVAAFAALSVLFISAEANAGEVQAKQLLRATAVLVSGYSCTGSGGIVRAPNGKQYLVTNAHVCNCAAFKGKLFSTAEGGELITGRIVKRNWALDLCAAEIPDRAYFLELARTRQFLTRLYTRGYPEGRLTESSGVEMGSVAWVSNFEIAEVGECPPESKVVRGYDGNLKACQIKFITAQTSLYSRPGSSGSPVVDGDGHLVGVISSVDPDAVFDGGMVRYVDVKKFMDGL